MQQSHDDSLDTTMSMVITEQPLTPSAPSVCPPGLEYLTTVDQLVIQQQSDVFQNFVGYEKYNKYVAKNVLGQFVYLFAEDSGCCKRWFCCTRRCFAMKVMDYRNVEVMRFIRPLRCDYCCAFCCLQYIEVQAPPTVTIAYLYQDWSPFFPSYTVYDRQCNPMISIAGPFCTQTFFYCLEAKFEVRTLGGILIGMITRETSGFSRSFYLDADRFNVTFPLDLDVHVKAALLACVMLIDFMFFETTC